MPNTITPDDIITAARHVLRPDATLEELEADAPRILACACRRGVEVRVTFRETPAFVFAWSPGATPEWWEDNAHLINDIWLDGERVA